MTSRRRRVTNVQHWTLSLTVALTITGLPVHAQQIGDTTFVPKVGAPAYAVGAGPVVLLDEAHNNFHTASGRYFTFVRTLERDGYVVRSNKSPLTRTVLAQAKVLVIANALAARNLVEWDLPAESAFDTSEVNAVRDWVRDGGSLLLIADHMPFPGSIETMASAFGVLMTNGFALDPSGEDGRFVFTTRTGSLGDHPITRGRTSAERVDSIVAFTGQAFRLEGAGTPLMTLGHGTSVWFPLVAWQFSRLTPKIPASGMLQGAALTLGRGRVAVFGEAAMFSAQVSGPGRAPTGMNHPGAPQNAQFLLNVMHWLTGLLS